MGEQSATTHAWFDAETTTFGDRMTGAREAAGLGQPDLAKRLGVKVKTIRAWENDQSEPRANKLGTLAGILGVSMMWLLSGQGDGPVGPDADEIIDEDIERILMDLRQLRQDQAQLAERAGRLEKRLKLALGAG